MREEVRSILKGVGATAILVTHDQEEALYFGDRLAVLRSGKLQQVDTPEGIFHSPVNQSVADFMGQTEFLDGEVTVEGIQTEIGLVEQYVELPRGTRVQLAVRADDVDIDPNANANGVIRERQFKGALNLYRVMLPSGQVVHSLQPHTRMLPPGTSVKVKLEPGHLLACFYAGEAVACKLNHEDGIQRH
jgi:iron(III) transport system ATP-binding protein